MPERTFTPFVNFPSYPAGTVPSISREDQRPLLKMLKQALKPKLKTRHVRTPRMRHKKKLIK